MLHTTYEIEPKSVAVSERKYSSKICCFSVP